MMMACPMPISRSRVSTMPAIVIDRQQKNAEPSSTTTADAEQPQRVPGQVHAEQRGEHEHDHGLDQRPHAGGEALPVTSAARGVGVTISLASTPASRSQMIWMP